MGLDNPIHIAFLLILLLLVFGAKRLPEMGRSLGDGMRGFKDALSGEGAHTASQPMPQPALTGQAQQPTPITAHAPAPTAVAEPRPPAAASAPTAVAEPRPPAAASAPTAVAGPRPPAAA
jgi:sec-independent protein translocase protein TatA